ncbi:MAG: hypothetical protein ACI8S6_003110 [Myxococcota bacterium]|jgi:hypothetical protein
MRTWALSLSALMISMLGCSGDKETDTADGSSSSADAVCEEPVDVECVDQIILDLSLHDDKVSEGEVATTTDGDDFVTTIDASAGGYNAAADNPWVYIRFTEDGAERVDIDDETALESMDWDLSMRRFILRLNGGSSGPSCVGAASFLESTYDELTEVPEGISYVLDAYYTSDCTIINDSSGLPDNPQVALSPWWSYSSCLVTTGVPQLIQLADGHVLKMVVESYYGSGQEDCNATGASGDDSAFYTLRWTWMTR